MAPVRASDRVTSAGDGTCSGGGSGNVGWRRRLFGQRFTSRRLATTLVRAHDGRPSKRIARVCNADKGRQTGAMAVVCGQNDAGAGDGWCSELEQVTSATAGAGVTREQVPSARDVDGMGGAPSHTGRLFLPITGAWGA